MTDCPSRIIPSSEILKKNVLRKAECLVSDFLLRPYLADGNARICIDVRGFKARRVSVGKETVLSLN